MGYTVQTDSKRTITWNDNPYGNVTSAVLVDDTIQELTIQDTNGINILYTKDQTLLSHIQTVITQLLAEIAAP